jgi:hypothetical protein
LGTAGQARPYALLFILRRLDQLFQHYPRALGIDGVGGKR